MREKRASVEYQAITHDRAWQLNEEVLRLALAKGRLGWSYVADSRGIFKAGGVTHKSPLIMESFLNIQQSFDPDIEAGRRQFRTVGRAVALWECSRLRRDKDFIGMAKFNGADDKEEIEDMALVREAIWRVSQGSEGWRWRLYSDLGVPIFTHSREFLQLPERCSFCDWESDNGFCVSSDSDNEAQKAAQIFADQRLSVGTYKHYKITMLGVAGCREHPQNVRQLQQMIDRYNYLIPEMLEDAKTLSGKIAA